PAVSISEENNADVEAYCASQFTPFSVNQKRRAWWIAAAASPYSCDKAPRPARAPCRNRRTCPASEREFQPKLQLPWIAHLLRQTKRTGVARVPARVSVRASGVGNVAVDAV